MHPILFAIGDFYIGSYGLMLALGLIAGSIYAVWRARQVNVPGPVVMDTVFCAVVAGIVGSRIVYIVINFGEFLDDPMALLLSRTHFVFLGGVIFAILSCYLYARWKKVRFLDVTDILASAIPLGHAFGRVGCFLAGCCYGSYLPPDSPFSFLAVRYPAQTQAGEVVIPNLAYENHLHSGLIKAGSSMSAPVWPVQLMESFGELCIFFLLFIVWRYRRFRGQVLISYLMLYSLLRFSLEFIRGDLDRGAVGVFSTSQLISLGLILIGVASIFILRKNDAVRIDSQ
ncbi:MAG: prolipoprotein diacylglyceryl transferase [Candidatus Sumerlaeia bacterium]